MVDELLDSYQHSLEIHFKALSDARAAEGLPVYALEHGLDAETLSKVAIGLKRSLTVDGRLSSHCCSGWSTRLSLAMTTMVKNIGLPLSNVRLNGTGESTGEEC